MFLFILCGRQIKPARYVCLTYDWFLFIETHRVKSDLDSIWFKIMFDKWITWHDSCIAVKKKLNKVLYSL